MNSKSDQAPDPAEQAAAAEARAAAAEERLSALEAELAKLRSAGPERVAAPAPKPREKIVDADANIEIRGRKGVGTVCDKRRVMPGDRIRASEGAARYLVGARKAVWIRGHEPESLRPMTTESASALVTEPAG